MNKLQITILKVLALTAICAELTGCKVYNSCAPETGHYYINPSIDTSSIARVIILAPDTSETAVMEDICRPLTDAFRKRHLFSVRAISQHDPAFRSLDIDWSSMLTMEKMDQIRKEMKADAIITGSITRWQPYPHLTVGLHLKMLDLRNGQLIWAIDQLWDSTDKRTEQRMRIFFDKQMRMGYQPMDWQLLVTSPRAFVKFITYEVAETFPGPADQFKSRPIVRKYQKL